MAPRTRLVAALALAALPACGGEPDLVVYVSLDQVFSEELVRRFEAETGLDVDAHYDTEASKTVGFTRRLLEERGHPRCDVFWNNEVAQTVHLAKAGLLQPYDSPSAAAIPEQFRDTQRRWTGFGARARILIVNTDLVPDPSVLEDTFDLLDPQWAGKAGIARPLTGTTLTHATALYQVLGEERAQKLLEGIRDAAREGDVHLSRSNGEVMTQVGNGAYAWGWTDTDDFNVALEKGMPVAAVYPDQGGIGTFVIPNTVAMVAGAPHPENARRFIDWVLSEEVERELAFARSAQIPVRDSVERPPHVRSTGEFDVMEVDFVALGEDIERRTVQLRELFVE